jgi:hypothetical protein
MTPMAFDSKVALEIFHAQKTLMAEDPGLFGRWLNAAWREKKRRLDALRAEFPEEAEITDGTLYGPDLIR